MLFRSYSDSWKGSRHSMLAFHPSFPKAFCLDVGSFFCPRRLAYAICQSLCSAPKGTVLTGHSRDLVSYWASIVVVDACLRECFYPEDFSEEHALFAFSIFRFTESVSEGAMGPLRCAYPVRVAFEIADDEARDYFRRWMGILSRRYAATAIYDES